MIDQELLQHIRVLQTSMAEAVGDAFLDSERDDLKVLVRLTIEFSDYLRRTADLVVVGNHHEVHPTLAGSGIHALWRVVRLPHEVVEGIYARAPRVKGVDVGIESHGLSSLLGRMPESHDAPVAFPCRNRKI